MISLKDATRADDSLLLALGQRGAMVLRFRVPAHSS